MLITLMGLDSFPCAAWAGFMQGLQSLQEAWLLGAESAGLPREENRWCQGQESFAAEEPRVNAELPDRGQDASLRSEHAPNWRTCRGSFRWWGKAEVPTGPRSCSQEDMTNFQEPLGEGPPQQQKWPIVKNIIWGLKCRPSNGHIAPRQRQWLQLSRPGDAPVAPRVPTHRSEMGFTAQQQQVMMEFLKCPHMDWH